MEQITHSTAIRLIQYFGGRQKAADALGVVGETLRLWRKHGIPLNRSLEIQEKTGGAITAEEILREAQEHRA